MKCMNNGNEARVFSLTEFYNGALATARQWLRDNVCRILAAC